MSKRMIDSEVSERIRYRWDEGNEDSHIDIDADYVDVTGELHTDSNINTSAGVYGGYITASYNLRGEKLWLTGTGNNIFRFRTGGQEKSMTGDMVANHQLYYHCVKLTSATKTVYVNIYSDFGTEINQAIKFSSAIKGDKGIADLDWYYGAGEHVVHCYWDKAAPSDWLKCFIDDERVTSFEDHTNGTFDNTVIA